MARKPRLDAPNLVHHVTAKGNGGALLFHDDTDRHGFLALLARAVGRTRWRVLAWCLMDNHVHLVIETPDPTLSVGMQWLCGEYARRLHRRHGTRGHVFNDRFHSSLVDDDVYLLVLVRYVTHNPVRAKMVPTVRHWRWSSHAAMAGGYEDAITATTRTDELFGSWGGHGRERYLRWVERNPAQPLPEPLQPMTWRPPTIAELVEDHGFIEGAIIAMEDHGHSARDIAKALNLAPSTVTRRLRNSV